MSYRKNAVIRDLTIFGFEDNPIASLGKEIDTVVSIDYFESIFEPAFEFQILFVSAENALSSLKLRTTEKVSLEIDHDTGKLLFDDLVLKSYLNVFIICFINPLRGSNVQVPVTDVENGIFT